MSLGYLTAQEMNDLTDRQLFTLESGYARGDYSLRDLGDVVPGAIMVHDLEAMQVTYMNDWGCEALNHSMDEINAMGEEYYRKFFIAEEIQQFLPGMLEFYKRNDHTALYTFFHQVRTGPKREPSWHYAVCKFLRRDLGRNKTNELILVANPVAGMGMMVNKVNKLLDENIFVAKNYKKFALLSKREKEIITLLADGKSTPEIADILFISTFTVSTHRRNIYEKLGIKSSVELLKFASAFELIK